MVRSAVDAVRRHGPDVGLDAMVAEAGVSKTVLYRHFQDKNDIISSVMQYVAELLLLPRLFDELSADGEDREKVRAAIAAYIGVVVSEPELYAFVFAHSHGTGRTDTATGRVDVVASTEQSIAQPLSQLLAHRLAGAGMDTGGAEAWAYGMVGMVQFAADRWTRDGTICAEALVDYLTMMAYGGLDCVLAAGGSPERFWASVPDRRPVRLLSDADSVDDPAGRT